MVSGDNLYQEEKEEAEGSKDWRRERWRNKDKGMKKKIGKEPFLRTVFNFPLLELLQRFRGTSDLAGNCFPVPVCAHTHPHMHTPHLPT